MKIRNIYFKLNKVFAFNINFKQNIRTIAHHQLAPILPLPIFSFEWKFIVLFKPNKKKSERSYSIQKHFHNFSPFKECAEIKKPSIFPFIQTLQFRDIVIVQNKIENIEILPHPLRIGAFWNRRNSTLNQLS